MRIPGLECSPQHRCGKLSGYSARNPIGNLRILVNDVQTDGLQQADSIDGLRSIEARASAAYWRAWASINVQFGPPRDVLRIPSAWLCFDGRGSAISGTQRAATSIPNALINYIGALARSQCYLAMVSYGLDPMLGWLHQDQDHRISATLDASRARTSLNCPTARAGFNRRSRMNSPRTYLAGVLSRSMPSLRLQSSSTDGPEPRRRKLNSALSPVPQVHFGFHRRVLDSPRLGKMQKPNPTPTTPPGYLARRNNCVSPSHALVALP